MKRLSERLPKSIPNGESIYLPLSMLFLRRSIQCGGFPFLVQTEFNTTTQNAFKEAEEIASDKRAAKRFHSVSETVAHIMGDNDDEV